MMEIVSFVILHYKDLETTDICVQSILKMEDRERIRIVIVDNDVNETPEYRNQIVKKYEKNPKIDILPITENGGFSYANNKGYEFARNVQKASYILVLNNDIEFIQKAFLKKLDNVFNSSKCHVIGPDVICQNTGEHQNPLDKCIRSKSEAEFTRKMNHTAVRFYFVLFPFLYLKNILEERRRIRLNKKNSVYYQSSHKNIVPFGACLIFTPLYVGRENRAFFPETSFYYEEYLLACRCKKMNYDILYTPELKVYHESGTATKKSYGSERKRLKFVMQKMADACAVYLSYIDDLDI